MSPEVDSTQAFGKRTHVAGGVNYYRLNQPIIHRMLIDVGKRSIDIGVIGLNVAANVQHHRTVTGITYVELSRRLADLGREIAVQGLRNIEAAERRVDVDDLVALAFALDVPVDSLLGPNRDVLALLNRRRRSRKAIDKLMKGTDHGDN